MQNNRTHASAIAPDQQKKIKIHNIILENIKHRSRSNEHPNNKSNEDSKTKQNEADDYCIKPGLIKFIKANVRINLIILSFSPHYDLVSTQATKYRET